ncbi:hypothetical protein [Ottowia sp.]|uniref:hypothetical protein n=1 Tax=Ottowia sp. TaxID=1898956 RepID=UPI0025CF3C0F|nr:hypothetical protein [Ottowia sp.]MBK6616526.1 hypothetical protein [Ottowia sp.]
MSLSRRATADWLKRRINVAKAECGLNWSQVADKMSAGGPHVTASSLMSKHSRASFTAVELVFLLQVLDVRTLEVPAEHKPSRRKAAGP